MDLKNKCYMHFVRKLNEWYYGWRWFVNVTKRAQIEHRAEKASSFANFHFTHA